MAGVYFPIRTDLLSDAVHCGLKLSEHADRDLVLPGETRIRRIMTACLHPDDFPDSRLGSGFRILRLDLDPAKCLVGDADMYRMGLIHPVLMQIYLKTLVLLRDYRFGTFRAPECLISNSVLDSQIEETGHAKGFPVVFENSASLYLRSRMGSYDEALADGGNALFFSWCRMLESKGHLERYADETGEKEVYRSKRTGEILVLSVPGHMEAVGWP
jgi:hypothetical protein